MKNESGSCGICRTITPVTLAFLLSGCSHVPVGHSALPEKRPAALKKVVKDEIVFLSSPEMDHCKPTLLLLHGATDEPAEMIDIVQEWRGRYNVLLYVYNYHKPLKTIAAHLVGETKALRAKNIPLENMTVITYSYSAAVFRMAVLIADDPAIFSDASLIQLVPTAGGSYLARWLKNPITAWFVSLASKPSAAENPYGRIAAKLWDGIGNRKFHEMIQPARMHTILIEDDPHSLANARDEGVRSRYKNGIGTNVVVIPKSNGVAHEYFPTHPVALEYLRKVLESIP